MSLPRNTASPPPERPGLSSSSSRQSLAPRKETPASATTSDRPLQGHAPQTDHSSGDDQHRPQAADTVVSPSHDGAVDDGEGQEQQLVHPPFQPFFTLIEDVHTSEYHHPAVHYIFSDDDTDIVTEAALRSLEAQQNALPDSKKEQILEHQSQYSYGEDELPSRKTDLLPPPRPGVRDNFIILDVEPASPEVTKENGGEQPGSSAQPRPVPTQFRVTSAQSLAPTWQVLNPELAPAPTFENSDPGEAASQGMMLKIRGTAGLPSGTPGRDRGDRGAHRLEDMMDQFAKRMSELQMVIDEGEPVKSPGREHPVEQPHAENIPVETSKDEEVSAEDGQGDTVHS